MEKTLQRLAAAGWRDFYDGELGRAIADGVQAAGGILSREDMASYTADVGEPYVGAYRAAKVYGPVLTHGSLTPLQMLQMLDCFEPVSSDQVIYWHRLAEVAKLAWRDRLLYLADPAFVEVPIERMLSPEYARGRVESLLQFPLGVDRSRQGISGKTHTQTLHVSAADIEENVVSMTITQGGEFGSCFTVPGTGIILGHGMCRLDPNPDRANSVAAGKRPLNNGCPLLVRTADRDVAIGVPGGRRIVCVATMMAQQLVDFEATSVQVARSPRLHVVTEEPVEILDTMDGGIVVGLRELGHEVELVDWICGNAHGAEVLKDEGTVRAGGNGWAAGAE
jgi:gamma-glutamyltranspeptidase/glutathione hydrolase